ncbi:unnamed protein product [Lepeophtheirus salmonis]|uniref:(salmon louse) hypothetical protein n=1 Tax=Lepeophtheirus salmonis TaxID=72036 RepID=A0A7R8H524_LEPSM|nr:unnamed protein product [Lepeophtheirus salmonis]CAF2860231.1 unnamed protein product [Lepeophtheirus salmonis]
MKYLALCTLVLCSAISIDAGVFSRRTGRNSHLQSALTELDKVGSASSFNQVTSSFGGSGSSFGGSSFGGSTGGASSGPAVPVVAIISESNNAPGTLGDNSDFDNSFEAENGIRQTSSGSTVTIGEESVVVMKGSYEYVGPDGQTYVVDWIADENGFQPSAPHLPKEVPIPFPEIAEAVAAQIAFAAQEDAAGGSASAGGFGGSAASGFGQSFGASSQSQSVVTALLLCSAISIDAGVFSRRIGRNSPPISSYGAGQVGSASSFNQVTTSFGGSGSSFGGSSFGGSAGGASSGPAVPVVAIISESNNAPAENGIRQTSSGSTVTIGEESVVVMKGSYEYIGGDDGKSQSHSLKLLKPLPAQIAFAAQEDAAGGSGSAGGFGGSAAGGFGQSFGASSQSQSVAPLTQYGR